MDEPLYDLCISETDMELILLFMKLGIVLQESLEIDLEIPDQKDYITMAKELYDELVNIAQFEFILRALGDEDEDD